MKKFSKKLLTILCATLVTNSYCLPVWGATAETSNSVSDLSSQVKIKEKLSFSENKDIDLSLEKEEHLYKQVIEKLYNQENELSYKDSTIKIFADSETLSKSFIPANAQCSETGILGDCVYFDYSLDNISYGVSYNLDGNITKTARSNQSDDIFEVNNQSSDITYYDASEGEDYSISEAEVQKHMEQMINEQWPKGSVYSLENTSKKLAKAATATVYPKKYTSQSDTKPYKAKNVLSGSTSILAFQGTKYDVSQKFKIYETMAYHVEQNRHQKLFKTGATVEAVAKFLKVATGMAKSWLTVAGVGISAAETIKEACEVVDEQSYTYTGGKECAIYDPTKNKKFVETYSYWDDGKIALTWSYKSGSTYRNPKWAHTRRSKALDTTDNAILDKGRAAYNNQIKAYGCWKSGVGNGFGK